MKFPSIESIIPSVEVVRGVGVIYQIVSGVILILLFEEKVKSNHYGYHPGIFGLYWWEILVYAVLVIGYVCMMINFLATESEKKT